MADEASRDGAYFIKQWVAARDALGTAKSLLISAECDLTNTTAALAEWLLPSDAKPGEKIAVWHGASLIQAECFQYQPHKVTIRTRGRNEDFR